MEYLRSDTTTLAPPKVPTLTFHYEQSLTHHSAAHPTSHPATLPNFPIPLPSHLAMSGPCTFVYQFTAGTLTAVARAVARCPCPYGQPDPLNTNECRTCSHLLSQHENASAPPTGILVGKLHFVFKTIFLLYLLWPQLWYNEINL